jgi:hypothetical protein
MILKSLYFLHFSFFEKKDAPKATCHGVDASSQWCHPAGISPPKQSMKKTKKKNKDRNRRKDKVRPGFACTQEGAECWDEMALQRGSCVRWSGQAGQGRNKSRRVAQSRQSDRDSVRGETASDCNDGKEENRNKKTKKKNKKEGTKDETEEWKKRKEKRASKTYIFVDLKGPGLLFVRGTGVNGENVVSWRQEDDSLVSPCNAKVSRLTKEGKKEGEPVSGNVSKREETKGASRKLPCVPR